MAPARKTGGFKFFVIALIAGIFYSVFATLVPALQASDVTLLGGPPKKKNLKKKWGGLAGHWRRSAAYFWSGSGAIHVHAPC